ncbi:MAG TPA: menaquinone biosynthesis protein [Chthoniobacteraceae bacterium]|nr:menaquinone biosynthesis protein [Chthoniobacteraceae bacterium]
MEDKGARGGPIVFLFAKFSSACFELRVSNFELFLRVSGKEKEMSVRYPALAAVRLGCVPYLNSKPLIFGCDAHVHFDHPSGLARDLSSGALDVALVPVFEALRNPPWLAVDDVAIACDGPVFSVFLAHRGELENVRRIALDPASLTSAHLLKVLLAEFHEAERGTDFQSVSRETDDTTTIGSLERRIANPSYVADARLLIGNQAIGFRTANPTGWRYLDLGEEWKRCTGLPFVFALWLMRPSLPNAAAIAAELRAIKRGGIAHIPEIVRADREHDPAVATRYLTEHIRFDCGPRERAGLDQFRELLEKHGLIAAGGKPIEFV